MILRNATENDEKKLLFQLFFLKNNDDLGVEVEEVENIDFTVVKRRIELGDSVFITRKCKQEFSTTLIAKKDAAEPLYFTRE